VVYVAKARLAEAAPPGACRARQRRVLVPSSTDGRRIVLFASGRSRPSPTSTRRSSSSPLWGLRCHRAVPPRAGRLPAAHSWVVGAWATSRDGRAGWADRRDGKCSGRHRTELGSSRMREPDRLRRRQATRDTRLPRIKSFGAAFNAVDGSKPCPRSPIVPICRPDQAPDQGPRGSCTH
jgi:hypothetical protein